MLTLTPDILRAAYDFLRMTEPFVRWNLPEGEDVVFKVSRSRKFCGRTWQEAGEHTIEISQAYHGLTPTLLMTMAHEMIHLHQREVGMETANVQHNEAFRKLATNICKLHGFDITIF